MSRQSVEAQLCAEHQRLLEECDSALRVWDEHRAEFCQFRFINREAGDELVRLQAKYARAYTVLHSHKRNCAVCQLAEKVNAPVFEEGAEYLQAS